MNYAIILSGGVGTRLGSNIPKQYIEVNGKPVIMYSAETIDKSPDIDAFCIVAAEEWEEYLTERLEKSCVSKFAGFAPAGKSRQHSILNGLTFLKNKGAGEGDHVLVHDAARPNLSPELISGCMTEVKKGDAVLPILPVKDTIYVSDDGQSITSLLNRDHLYAGQAPESFDFEKYFRVNSSVSDEELGTIRGSVEIAHKYGMKVLLIKGDPDNYKITTSADLEKFIEEQNG